MTIDRIVRQTLEFFAQTYAVGVNDNERSRTDLAAYDFLESVDKTKRPAYLEIYNQYKDQYQRGVTCSATRTSTS